MSDEKHTAKKRSSSASTARNGCPTIDLQERTLRVTNIDSKVTKELLRELFNQKVGPVVNVVLKPDFAFIEFEDSDSVAYAIAMMDGVKLFDSELNLQPKLQKPVCKLFLISP
ncbi:hypothetical protein B4U79_05741 [Dinothrombium tinctorium]|uniref:RRM domain-containing protein n=1 Tax=Dinothrombium tinctorium TaxID=1965070 RepID=A0A3S3NZ88_9ACAR|nr:hypothetical protein B4U79_05741 [Dinothrombium tinctorium]